MKGLFWFVLLFFGYCSNALSQCPPQSFTVPETACINTDFLIENIPDDFAEYQWDFCAGDLKLTPSSEIAASNTLLFRTRSIRIVQQGDQWYGFTIDQANSPYRLIRFSFGSSLLNAPTITNLGNPQGLLNGSYDLQLYHENNVWYALVANSGGNNLLKITFGEGLDMVPTIEDLGSFGNLNVPNGIFIERVAGMLFAFVTNGGEAKITRLDFGNSINNTPVVTSFPVPGAVTLRGLSLIRECNRWFGLVTSYGNNKVFWLDFVDGIQQVPQSGEITFFTNYNFPANVSIVIDGAEYFAFIQSALGPLYKLSFGESIIDKSGSGVNLGNLDISPHENFALELIKVQSDWIGFSIDLTNRRLVRLTFPTTCDASIPVYQGIQPPLVNYNSAGQKDITLTVQGFDGSINSLSEQINVGAGIAPDITFTSQNLCANHDIDFTSYNTSENITAYAWDFGDSNNSSLPNPSHIFSTAGEYDVGLLVTASNGCQNVAKERIRIHNEPLADFAIPAIVPMCTNQQYNFGNVSVYDVDFSPTWQWHVNGTLISTEQDLDFSFSTPVSQEIKLIASIPGCESEITKTISSVSEGSLVDFSFSGHCEDEPVTFTNTSSGTITGYSWDFGTGQTSTDENPENIFTTAGTYDVTLTASNAAGCNNTHTQQIVIYSKPELNFSVLLPPFSCSGTPTLFNNTTPSPSDSNIESWLWNFGDAGSSQNTSAQHNPQHIYTDAGEYSVLLTATTNFACSATLEKTITIHQTPQADFIHTPICEDITVTFSDASSGTPTAWSWQIASGFYTSGNPEHIFTNPGSYDVTLSVTDTNNCIGTITKTVIVPAKLMPDFAVTKNCAGHEAEFTDITNDSVDPVAEYAWSFAGIGSAETNPVVQVFPNAGDYTVMLTLTTQTGCVYSVGKTVTVVETPVASFTATPISGEAPLEVQFNNASGHASNYLWMFNGVDGPVSTQVNPLFTFLTAGEYPVMLIALNMQGCSDTVSVMINAFAPLFPFLSRPPYPNPVPGDAEINVQWETNTTEELNIQVIDALGHEIGTTRVQSVIGMNHIALKTTGLRAGVYFFRLTYQQYTAVYRVVIL
ncbi:MAG: PKD domain-containing protein [Cyclobacteriaceae bacterium]|nr:PKD domain-containing protein [Cyclobacteriaceae bacterium]